MSENKFDGLEFDDFEDDETIYDMLPEDLVEALREVKNNPPKMDWKVNQPKLDKFVDGLVTLWKVLPHLGATMKPIDFTPQSYHRVVCVIPEPARRISPVKLQYFAMAAAKFDDVGLDFSQEGFVIADFIVDDVYYPIF